MEDIKNFLQQLPEERKFDPREVRVKTKAWMELCKSDPSYLTESNYLCAIGIPKDYLDEMLAKKKQASAKLASKYHDMSEAEEKLRIKSRKIRVYGKYSYTYEQVEAIERTINCAKQVINASLQRQALLKSKTGNNELEIIKTSSYYNENKYADEVSETHGVVVKITPYREEGNGNNEGNNI